MNVKPARISVVVPSTLAALPGVLAQALAEQTLRPLEVIHVHDEKRHGAAWARNRGIEIAKGEIVACIDDDCVPPAHWLQSVSDAFAHYDADVVGGTYDESDSFLRARRDRQRFPARTGLDASGHVGAGGNIAFRMAALAMARARDGHVFNESFRISQDWELAWRLRDLGATFVFLAVPVKHVKSLSPLGYLHQQFSRGIGIARLAQARRRLGPFLQTHRSLLWSDPDCGPWKTLARLIWYKGIGPFDWRSFASPAQFWLFWLGEKIQSAGYLWARALGKPVHRSGQASPA